MTAVRVPVVAVAVALAGIALGVAVGWWLRKRLTLDHLAAAIEASPDAIFVKDRHLRYVACNDAWLRLVSVRRENAIGATDADLFPPEIAAPRRARDLPVIERGETVLNEHTVEVAGEDVLYVSRKDAYRDRKGRIAGMWGTATDITERRRLENERDRLLAQVQRQLEQLTELDRLKDDFLATVSHELRTPLASILGYLELLSESELDEEDAGFVAVIDRNAHRLLQLVEDLLLVSRLQSGRIELARVDVELGALARDCLEAARPRAGVGEIVLGLETNGPVVVTGDPTRLAQVLDNLVSNAIKFTPAGGTVTVRLGRNRSHAVVEVADTGIGIPRDEQPRLFDRFFRASTATERAIKGTGLGLWITRAITEAHGGSIDVESEAGEGTSFRIRLPLAA
jgi:PAS domain S-box-containing protein